MSASTNTEPESPTCETCETRKATHWYAVRHTELKVCVPCYKNHARADEGAHRIPADYDWDTELDRHRLPIHNH